jgi:hypothetical protein
MQPKAIEDVYTHRPEVCAGDVCCIHNPSNHPLRNSSQVWRPDKGIVERICPHGIGHPDPDDVKVRFDRYARVHGCDGCCHAS